MLCLLQVPEQIDRVRLHARVEEGGQRRQRVLEVSAVGEGVEMGSGQSPLADELGGADRNESGVPGGRKTRRERPLVGPPAGEAPKREENAGERRRARALAAAQLGKPGGERGSGDDLEFE